EIVSVQPGGKFLHEPTVDVAHEGDDLPQRIPVADPAPAIELGFGGPGHAHAFIGTGQTQQEPLLLLAHANRLGMAADQPLRQTIPQPAPGTAEYLHIAGQQPDLLVELAIQRLLGVLIAAYAALRK